MKRGQQPAGNAKQVATSKESTKPTAKTNGHTQPQSKSNASQPASKNADEVVKLTNAARKKILQLHSYGVNVADIHRIVQNEVQKEARYYDVYAAVKVARTPEMVS
jgi:hypothetical protein